MKRLQRKRTKGWKMPPNAVYVGRPTKWGNPYENANLFRGWLNGDLGVGDESYNRRMTILNSIGELRGKDLVCWCALDKPCHADVLLELANRTEAKQ